MIKPSRIVIDTSADLDVDIVAVGKKGWFFIEPLDMPGGNTYIRAYNGTVASPGSAVGYNYITTTGIHNKPAFPSPFRDGLHVVATDTSTDWVVYYWPEMFTFNRFIQYRMPQVYFMNVDAGLGSNDVIVVEDSSYNSLAGEARKGFACAVPASIPTGASCTLKLYTNDPLYKAGAPPVEADWRAAGIGSGITIDQQIGFVYTAVTSGVYTAPGIPYSFSNGLRAYTADNAATDCDWLIYYWANTAVL